MAGSDKQRDAQSCDTQRRSSRRGFGGKSRSTAADIARYNVGTIDELDVVGDIPNTAAPASTWVGLDQTNKRFKVMRWSTTGKLVFCLVVLLELAYLSLGIMGAAGQDYSYTAWYTVYDPVQVARALGERVYGFIGDVTHLYSAHSLEWIRDNVPGYWGVWQRAGVVVVTIICAVLLSVSGMLYQNVFKNPIAGPGMLGVSSGVSLGVMVLVMVFGTTAASMVKERYLLCYGFGAAILVFVILAGKHLSGRGRSYDIMAMVLIGSMLSSVLGSIVSYVTLYAFDEDHYNTFYTISQMLTIDTSLVSWLSLGVACLASIVPVWLLRSKMNALAFDQDEVRMMGVNLTRLRAVALICGAIMILAAQVHTGMVGMVSLVVPFLARNWFGCEFKKQLAGCVGISTIFLLLCRDIADLVPFVGDGLAIGAVVSFAAIPLFLVVVTKCMNEWE